MLTLAIDDQGNTGGGNLTDNDTATLNITADNDAPVHTFPASVNATENVPYTFTGAETISVADPDVGLGNV